MFLRKAFCRYLTYNANRYISKVYKKGEISDDLLITLSMNQNSVEFKSHEELINSLILKNFLNNDDIISSFRKLDRAYFIDKTHNQTQNQIYLDRPYNIGEGQSMTSPMMHAIVIEALYPYLKRYFIQEMYTKKILDIGTGSGYISFVLYDLINTMLNQGQYDNTIFSIHAIDLYQEIIKNTNLRYANLVEKGIIKVNNTIKLAFKKEDFFDLITDKKDMFDIINVGAAVDLDNFIKLKKIVKKDMGVLLAPVIRNDGEQNLTMYDSSNDQEKILMRVVYSPIIKSESYQKKVEIEKFFYQDNEPEIESSKGDNKTGIKEIEKEEINNEQNQFEKSLKLLDSEIVKIENLIKTWQENFKEKNKIKPTLKDMQEDNAISNLIKTLQQKKKEKRVLIAIKNAKA